MNCKGCEHCVLLQAVDYPEIVNSFHYCDIIWGYDADGGSVSISESWKKCKGISYKPQQYENNRNNKTR